MMSWRRQVPSVFIRYSTQSWLHSLSGFSLAHGCSSNLLCSSVHIQPGSERLIICSFFPEVSNKAVLMSHEPKLAEVCLSLNNQWHVGSEYHDQLGLAARGGWMWRSHYRPSRWHSGYFLVLLCHPLFLTISYEHFQFSF